VHPGPIWCFKEGLRGIHPSDVSQGFMKLDEKVALKLERGM